MNRRTLLLSAGAAGLAACAAQRPRTREFTLAPDLDAAVARAMTRLAVVPGLAVAVYTREGVYARGFGVRDVDTGERAHADTAFYIASSTKPLTAMALATLADRDELDLDQTLAEYAPDAQFPESVRPGEVKLRDLLTHTHGIQNNAIVHRTAFSGQHDAATLWRLLANCEANDEAPLGTFDYTNVGYNIATILTDRRVGVRWQDLLQREIFAAAGMRRSSAYISRAAEWSLARPHASALPGPPQRIYLEKTDQTMQSAGGVIMSANDALRWLELMIENGRVEGRQIIPESVVQTTRQPLASVGGSFGPYRREHYGLGWYLGPYRDQPMLHHFGGFAGARAHVSYMPAVGAGVAAFVNDSDASFELVDAIANYAYDRLLGAADAEGAFDAAVARLVTERDAAYERAEADRANRAARTWTLTRPRQAYAGAYENQQYGRIEVSADGEALEIRFGVLRAVAEPFTRPDSIRVELVPYSGTVLQFAGEGARPEAVIFQNQRFGRF